MSTVPKTSLISVVIPTLNEENNLAATLAAVASGTGLEVLVVDGGSTDRTIRLAEEAGARVVASRPGRAIQQNAGAAAASGDILLFLHGDTLLPPGFADLIRSCLADGGVAAGAFSLAIGGSGTGLRCIETMANCRAKWLQLPYGDQGLFMTTTNYSRAGGFPEIEIMEDFALVRRLRQAGRIEIVPAAVRTSARRWQQLGVWRTTLINQGVIIGYLLGRPPASLASWYRRSSRAR